MKDENITDGYDLFTEDVDKDHEANQKYGEVHICDAWKPACKHYCVTKGYYMPLFT